MATLGDSIAVPESGWLRIDNTNPNIIYSSEFTETVRTGEYNGSAHFNLTGKADGEIRFWFKGTKLRIISPNGISARTANAEIYIDGVKSNFRTDYNNLYMVISYEKVGLENKLHEVVLKNFTVKSSSYAPFGLDAIDIDADGEFRFPYKKAILKHSDSPFSLDDKTLIHLPDASDKNMILHGIEQGKEIQLDAPFDKINYVNDTPVVNMSGKMFAQEIGVVSTLTLNTREVK